MTIVYDRNSIRLHHGDCLSVMPALGVQVDSIITDPPYGLGFMGKAWDHGVPGVPFWQAALDCTNPGGMLLAFGGDRTHHRLMVAIEDAGWEIRTCIYWVFGQGFPKSLDISRAIDKAAGAERKCTREGVVQSDGYGEDWDTGSSRERPRFDESATAAAKLWKGYGTALKPAVEIIVLAMKPLDGTFAENAQRHGVAGLAIDACRIQTGEGRLRVNEDSQQRRYTDSGGTNFAATPGPRGGDLMGRFPANLIHDGSDEVLAGFPQTNGETKPRTLRRLKATTGWSGGSCQTDDAGSVHCDLGGSAARFFYCAKASRSERGKTNTHPTVKPLALMRYLCRLTKTPTGGTVLDPFAGSGSTLIAASLEGRAAIGIEQDGENCRIAVDRFGEHFSKEHQRELIPA